MYNEIKKFFDEIDTNNFSSVRTQNCLVRYTTDNPNYNFEDTTAITVNISNRDYYTVELNELDEKKYYTTFSSSWQQFYFDEDNRCLKIIGSGNYKKFKNYRVVIFII